MTRLLFAAARGARIQQECYNWTKKDGKEWRVAHAVALPPTGFNFRIHPDDEHLQYGPISTALRETAQKSEVNGLPPFMIDLIKADFYYADFYYADSLCFNTDVLTRSLFLLLLSEALADEGL